MDDSLPVPGIPPGDLDASVCLPDISPDMPAGAVYVGLSPPSMPSSDDVDASVAVADMPSVDVAAPRKSLFAKLFTKSINSKATIEVCQQHSPTGYSFCMRGIA